MKRDYTIIMADRTDKELVDIVTLKHDEYEADALIAAVNELERRHVNVKAFYSEEQISGIKLQEQREIETLPFNWKQKSLIVALPLGILILSSYIADRFFSVKYGAGIGFCLIFLIQRLIYRGLKESYKLKRAAEFKRWTAYTVYIYLSILVMATIYVLLFGLP